MEYIIPAASAIVVAKLKRYADVLLQRRGNSKANELTTLIANAKATIREQYPDADQPITD